MDNPFDFTSRTIVVSGASRGIGKAIAASFLRHGADVISLQRGALSTDLVALANENGVQIRAVPTELSDPDSVQAAINDVTERTEVDVLVNNAGVQQWHDSVTIPLEQFDQILRVNLRAVFQLCQGFGRPMIDRGEGKIINLASMTSFIGGFRAPAYAASKGAVAQLTKALCNEWAQYGVNVNAIAPGYLQTEMNQHLIEDPARSAEIMSRIPAKHWGDPESIADAALFLASPAAAYIHGAILPVDGGWLAR